MPKRQLAAIMFTDMVGYTRLMQHNENTARIRRDSYRDILKQETQNHRGEILQFYGDGTLCIFDSSIEAVGCAIQIQTQVMAQNIPLRVGIHTGDIAHDAEGVYGDGVNVASRIESLAAPGSVLISEKVYDDIKNQESFQTQSMGRFELKNVDRPVEVYALGNKSLVVPQLSELSGEGGPVSKSIAVLPLVNMSNDPENEFFSDGVSEEILNALAKIDGLQVTARTSSFAFKGKNMDVREIGEQLKVRHVLEGSVRKAGNQVRITTQLINTTDGYHIWSETFDRKLEDIFALQDEISNTIAHRLREKLALKEPAVKSRPTQNLEAYNLYLKGNHHWNKWSPEDAKKAIEAFKKAIVIQPDFVLPYTGLSACYTFLGVQGQMLPREACSLANEYAEKGLELDPDQEMGHVAMAMVYFMQKKEFGKAEASFKKALDLNPNLSLAHQFYAMFLAANDEMDRALSHIKKAEQLDPMSVVVIHLLGHFYFMNHQYEEASDQFHRALELEPHFRMALESLGWVHYQLGDVEMALQTFQKYQKMTVSQDRGLSGVTFILGKMGRTKEVMANIKKTKQRAQREKGVSLNVDLAIMYHGLGDMDKTYYYLKKASDDMIGVLFLKNHPSWDGIRGDPRYPKLIKNYGF